MCYCVCVAVRLIGGNESHDGRLEYFHSGEWGTVCDHDFDDLSASVACQQLGFQLAAQLLCLSSQLFFLVYCGISRQHNVVVDIVIVHENKSLEDYRLGCCQVVTI